MKIAYIDLAIELFEDYSIKPKRYGGGRVFASLLKEFPNFVIFAPALSFTHVGQNENRSNCIAIDHQQKARIIQGQPLKDIISNAAEFDLFVHLHTNISLNLTGLKAKQLLWLTGYGQEVNPQIKDVALYNDYQDPHFQTSAVRKHYFTLGYPLEPFKIRNKSDFIFQCSRHVDCFNSIQIASFCLRNKIKGIFAGPIGNGYKLLDFIDNHTTFYLGEVTEEEKISLTQSARLYTLLHNWPTPFSLSAVEALSSGTPVVCSNVGFWPSLIKHGINGFIASNEDELMHAWLSAPAIDPTNCYLSALPYSSTNMIHSLYQVFEKVMRA